MVIIYQRDSNWVEQAEFTTPAIICPTRYPIEPVVNLFRKLRYGTQEIFILTETGVRRI